MPPNPYVGYAQLINGEGTSDGNQFPAVPHEHRTGNSGTVPVIELPVMNGHATAVWEVVNTNPNTLENFKFAVYATYVGNPAQNTPTPGNATVNLSYAPNANSGVAGDASVPLPRFIPDPIPSEHYFQYELAAAAPALPWTRRLPARHHGRQHVLHGSADVQLAGGIEPHAQHQHAPGRSARDALRLCQLEPRGAMAQTITVPFSSTTYIANFNTEYLLTTNVSPAAAGPSPPAAGRRGHGDNPHRRLGERGLSVCRFLGRPHGV